MRRKVVHCTEIHTARSLWNWLWRCTGIPQFTPTLPLGYIVLLRTLASFTVTEHSILFNYCFISSLSALSNYSLHLPAISFWTPSTSLLPSGLLSTIMLPTLIWSILITCSYNFLLLSATRSEVLYNLGWFWFSNPMHSYWSIHCARFYSPMYLM